VVESFQGNEFDVYGTYAEAVLNADCWDTIQALVQRKSIAKNFEVRDRGYCAHFTLFRVIILHIIILQELESSYKLNYRLIVKYLLYNLLLGPIVHCYDNYFNSIDVRLALATA